VKDIREHYDGSAWNYPDDLVEAAWGLVANAWGGEWSQASEMWRDAATHWRAAYHESLRSENPRAVENRQYRYMPEARLPDDLADDLMRIVASLKEILDWQGRLSAVLGGRFGITI
jgi:hypothetical protein